MTDYERHVAALYDGQAEQYLERIRPRQSYWAPVAEALGGVSEGTLLDVGCGPGHLTAALPPAVRVHGIDSSAAMIAAAQNARPDGIYEVRSFDEPLPDDWPSFDHVVVAGCIEFCADLPALLGRLRAALRPGGRIVATIPEDRRLLARRGILRIRGGAELIPTQQYSFLGAAEAIEAAGLYPATYAHIPGWVDGDGIQHDYGLWTLVAPDQQNSAEGSGAPAGARSRRGDRPPAGRG